MCDSSVFHLGCHAILNSISTESVQLTLQLIHYMHVVLIFPTDRNTTKQSLKASTSVLLNDENILLNDENIYYKYQLTSSY